MIFGFLKTRSTHDLTAATAPKPWRPEFNLWLQETDYSQSNACPCYKNGGRLSSIFALAILPLTTDDADLRS